MTTLLIDADVLCFRAASASEQIIHWDGQLTTLHSTLGDAWDKAMEILASWKKGALERPVAHDIVLAWSDPDGDYFRFDVFPEYKAGRKTSRKPLSYWPLRARLESEFESYSTPRLEGDDMLGIMATSGEYADPIIVSPDKDMATIPGRWYNPDKDDGRPLGGQEMRRVAQAEYSHFFQTLVGDRTDGYPGCRRVGEKTAAKILDPLWNSEGLWDEAWDAVVAAYEKAGLTEADALTNARCAYILQAGDYNFDTREVTLWTP